MLRAVSAYGAAAGGVPSSRAGSGVSSAPARVQAHMLILSAALLTGLILLVPAYLLLRAVSAGQNTLDTLLSPRTWAVLGNTLLLASIDHRFGLQASWLFKPAVDIGVAAAGFLAARHWIYRP